MKNQNEISELMKMLETEDLEVSQLSEVSPELFAASNPLFNTIFEQSKKMMTDMVEFKELIMMYTCAMKTIKTKLDILDTEYNVRLQRNPIKFIDTRLKRTSSIVEKMQRNNIPFRLRISKNT